MLAVASCTGTEHAVFIPLDPTVTPPPDHRMDAAVRPVDAAMPAPPDGGPPEDAGGEEDAGVEGDPDLDRTVTFDWNETLPGQGTCRAGQYIGSFTCTVPPESDASGASPQVLSGQVVFTLGVSSEQQVLSVTRGAVKDTLGFNAGDVAGSLRCTDKTFTAYTFNGLSWFPFGVFEAMFGGAFDDQALVIEGDFAMVNDVGERCFGDFHVSAAP